MTRSATRLLLGASTLLAAALLAWRFWPQPAAPARPAAVESEAARAIGPRDHGTLLALASDSRRRGDVAGSNRYLESAMSRDPLHRADYLSPLITNHILLSQYTQALSLLDQSQRIGGSTVQGSLVRIYVLLAQGKLKEAQALAASIPPGTEDADGSIAATRCELARLARDPAGMLKALEGRDLVEDAIPADALRTVAYFMMHDKPRADAERARARSRLASLLARRPDNPDLLGAVTDIEANGGDPDAALKAAEREVAQDPLSKDPIDAVHPLYDLAATQALLGRTGPALETLETLLAAPTHGGATSVAILRLDPDFDKLRGDPRFQALLARHEGDAQ